MLKREIKITADGSPTLYIPAWEESYHSKHGALQEALHVFIKNGWDRFTQQSEIKVLEYGFGTGLNALLTQAKAEEMKMRTRYDSIEKFPVSPDEINRLPIPQTMNSFLDKNEESLLTKVFKKIHDSPWDESVEISAYFNLNKIFGDFKSIELQQNHYDVVYFDAFGKRVQPELWTEQVFEKAYASLRMGGLLTTYASNRQTKRALLNIGFEVEKLAGPPGKREMINAWKK
ncbi:tRNA (5-methylaminomethyl-2-thiouridine)(34)-methyltransferase MnmD [Flavobacteriaceae bacterium Ap0902]|nr:tRNA (5-methylaminomethyl-2-thiouridine)(34)-methyltransferase MnmD [Flavobacteriaceae bacterium Ap0902]